MTIFSLTSYPGGLISMFFISHENVDKTCEGLGLGIPGIIDAYSV